MSTIAYVSDGVTYRRPENNTIDEALKEKEEKIPSCTDAKYQDMIINSEECEVYAYCRNTGDICKSSGSERAKSMRIHYMIKHMYAQLPKPSIWDMRSETSVRMGNLSYQQKLRTRSGQRWSTKGCEKGARLTMIITHVEHWSKAVNLVSAFNDSETLRIYSHGAISPCKCTHSE